MSKTIKQPIPRTSSKRSNAKYVLDLARPNNKFDSFLMNRKHIWILILCLFFILIVSIIAACRLNAAADELKSQNRQLYLKIEESEEEFNRNIEQINKLNAISSMTDESVCKLIKSLKTLNLPEKQISVGILYQYPELPSACECLALTNQLNYYGYNLTKWDIVDNYLIYSDDFVNGYNGSPYSEEEGGTILAPGITSIANNFLSDQGNLFKAFDVSGRSLEDLFAYIERGHPVQIWASLDMQNLWFINSTYGDYSCYEGNHSMLLTGFDREAGTVQTADSIYGRCAYDIDTVKKVYDQQQKQAVVIISNDEIFQFVRGKDASYDSSVEYQDLSNTE